MAQGGRWRERKIVTESYRPVPLGGPEDRPVAYLTGEYPRASHTFIQREVAGLRALGLTVRTCSIRDTDPAEHVGAEMQAEAAATFRVIPEAKKLATIPRALGRALRRPGRLLSTLALAWRSSPPGLRARLWQLFYVIEALILARHLQDIGARHLHNHFAMSSSTVAMLAARLADIPYSFTLHGPDSLYTPYHWHLKEKIRQAAFVSCISHFARSQAMVFAERDDWKKLHIVHCGIEPERYDHAPYDGPPRLLFVGRLSGVKGVPVLLEALARLAPTHPELRVTLIGDGPDRAALEGEAAERGVADRCDFVGFRSQAEVAEALTQHSALVLPSFAEGLPVVLMEALASARPVVTTRIAGVAELVEDGVNGRVVAPGDVAALTDALADVLAAPERAAAWGAAGREAVLAGFVAPTEAARLATLITRGHAALRPEPLT